MKILCGILSAVAAIFAAALLLVAVLAAIVVCVPVILVYGIVILVVGVFGTLAALLVPGAVRVSVKTSTVEIKSPEDDSSDSSGDSK